MTVTAMNFARQAREASQKTVAWHEWRAEQAARARRPCLQLIASDHGKE